MRPPADEGCRLVFPQKYRVLRVARRGHSIRFRLRSSTRELLSSPLAGVPGFEPGLSVLETDVLTVDTIPLLTLPIFDCRLLATENQNWKSAIGNRKCHLVCFWS